MSMANDDNRSDHFMSRPIAVLRGWLAGAESVSRNLLYRLYRHRVRVLVAVAAATIIAIVAVLFYADAAIQYWHDCPSPRDIHRWTYVSQPKCLPAPPLMTYHFDAKDLGPLAAALLPVMWYLPLVPPALFLAAVIAALSFNDRAIFNRDIFSLLLRAIMRAIPSAIYICIGLIGSYWAWPSGWALIGTVALVTSGCASLQWRLGSAVCTVASSKGAHRRQHDTERRRIGRQRLRVKLVVAVLLGGLLNGSAALLIRDSRTLKELMNDRYPRLFGSVSITELERNAAIDPALSADPQQATRDKVFAANRLAAMDVLRPDLEKPGLLSTADMKRLRAKVRAVADVKDGDRNPVTQNLCLGGWYVGICCACLAVAVLFSHSRAGSSLLAFVVTAYLAVGIVFGVVYYDYWVRDAARYNMLIQALCVDATLNVADAAKKCDTCSERVKAWSNVQVNLASNRKFLDMVASGYFATSVFSQDSPEITVDNDPPPIVARVLTSTYQFRLRSSAIEPSLSLYYSLKPLDGKMSCGREFDDVFGEGKGGGNTNAAASARIAMFVGRELTNPPLGEEISYIVRVKGGADCLGADERNVGYSGRRSAKALSEARGVFNRVEKLLRLAADTNSSLKLYPVKVARLREAFDDARLDNLVTHRTEKGDCDAHEYDDTLWPVESRDGRTAGDSHSARAAVVQVFMRSADVTDRIHMQSGLSREATLMDMVYFSFVCFTTTGYGDMKAVSGPVRFCVIIENILEILFAAIFFTAAMEVVKG